MPDQTFVLVAEDEELVRLVIVQALLDEGFEVMEVEHAEAALIVLESHGRRIHVFYWLRVSRTAQIRARGAEMAEFLGYQLNRLKDVWNQHRHGRM